MNVSKFVSRTGAIALVSVFAGCATWNSMDRQEKGTAAGATGGAIVGAAVGGPIGAAVGAGVGGYAGHYEYDKLPLGNARTASAPAEAGSADVRAAQQALNDRGYDAGAVDGVFGPQTESALRSFQQTQGLPETGTLDSATLAALGVSQSGTAAPAASSPPAGNAPQ
ncbi:MAG: peptidoglycan-binding domain-containing protein [Rudaea sp.]